MNELTILLIDDEEVQLASLKSFLSRRKYNVLTASNGRIGLEIVKENVVDLLCLGTDFDGYIDPANKYATILDFQQMHIDLVETINKDPDKDTLLFGLTPDQLVEKICFSNALNFVFKNFK